MSDQKDFFDMSSKQSLVMGLLGGIAIISVVGLIVLAAGKLPSEPTEVGNVAANTNVAPTPTPTPTPTPAPSGDVSKISPVGDGDYPRGGKNAKVTLIEYSDFECSFCGRHTPTIEALLDKYGDDIRVIFRHFPLSSIHPNAQKAAEASECAGEQGKFWEMHDLLFDNQSALGLVNLKSYAVNLGLDQNQFNECLDSSKYASKISKQAAEAQAGGITGTPGTFVNDQLVKGAYPVATFEQIIDSILK
jgi:protein-disulfide isomerase